MTNFLTPATAFSNPNIRTGTVAAASTSNAADFQDNYLLAIAVANNIPFRFTLG